MGASLPPKVTLLTALPLVWGEGDASDVLAGRARRSPMLDGLTIRPIDTVSAATLGHDVLVIAQPRMLAPVELVALDTWVRGGGQAIIFSDPRLAWSSAYRLGDVRRAPPVGLLDPLFAHWGVTLRDDTAGVVMQTIEGFSVTTVDAGRWQVPAHCTVPQPWIADCPIGRGYVRLVADADILDSRLTVATGSDAAGWLRANVRRLARSGGDSTPELPLLLISGGLVIAGVACILWNRRRRVRT